MLWILNFSYAQGQILSGFTINGNKANQPAYSSDSYQDGVWLQAANNSIVQNLAIWNVQTCSIGCWSTTYQATSNVTIQNNFFNGSRLGLGGLLSSTIANNFIHYGDGHAEAIEMMGSTNPVSGNTITNNHIFDTSLNGGPNTIGIGIKTIAFTGTYNKDNIITNNYINNSNNGILVSGNCFSNIITNNQISFSGYGVVFNDGYLNQIKMNQFDHDTVGVLLQEGA